MIRRWRGAAGTGVALAGLSVAAPMPPVSAAFHAIDSNPGNTWGVTTRILLPYTAQVLADSPYLYYPLDEAGGTTAVDGSGHGRTGTYVAIAGYHQPGGLPNNPGYAVALNGGGARICSGGTALFNPTTFTLELWFKTTTTAGGKLIGFDSTQSATSAQYDRYVFMDAAGHLVYGGRAPITTPNSYNDGNWHHMVLSSNANGAQPRSTFYLDGVSVATGSTIRNNAYSGWWQVGYGDLPNGHGYPSSANFDGAIDNIAVYQTELSAARVAAHYAAR